MRAISFTTFKNNCKHLEIDRIVYGDRDVCLNDYNKKIKLFHSVTEEIWDYNPCEEKYCPVMQSCKKL